jgi:NADH dehydrogenase [ubiquinone] 1 alpha subcomplex assembly factor 7
MILRRGRININKNAIERCIFSGLFSNHNYSRRRSSSYNNNNNNSNNNNNNSNNNNNNSNNTVDDEDDDDYDENKNNKNKNKIMREIRIDRTGLYEQVQRKKRQEDNSNNNNNKRIDDSNNESGDDDKKNKTASVGLLSHVESLIRFRGGPITMHEFMGECLTNPEYGYYTKLQSKDLVFGKKGDFTTSPEISQIFGELLGVWCATIYEQLQNPDELHLIEFGPGRGTLMMDLLRGTKNFKKFSKAIKVHLIEISPAMRKKQFETLKCEGDFEQAFDKLNNPLLAAIKTNPFNNKTNKEDDDEENDDKEGKLSTKGNVSAITSHGTKIYWHNSLDDVPSGPTCIIAHEFFDALPVHQFRRTERGWVEKLVAMNEENDKLEFVLSPGATLSSSQLVKRRLNVNNKNEEKKNDSSSIVSLEISPKSIVYWEKMMDRINDEEKNGGRGGAAIAIDYGDEGPLGDTLIAIKDHKFIDNPLESPGECDLSAHVDFGALRGVVEERNREKSSDVKCFGPITQQKLLLELGIVNRLEKLAETCTEEELEVLADGCQRLVGDDNVKEGEMPGMGLRYKALCMVSKNLKIPAGFN